MEAGWDAAREWIGESSELMDEDGNDATIERYFFLCTRRFAFLSRNDTAESPDRLFPSLRSSRRRERGEKSYSFFFLAKAARHQHVLPWAMNSKPRSATGNVFPACHVNWKKLRASSRQRELVYSRAVINCLVAGVHRNRSGGKNRRSRWVRVFARRAFARKSLRAARRTARDRSALYLEVKFRVL